MSDGLAAEGTTDAATARRPWAARVAVVAALALLYSYDLFEAISNVAGVVGQVEAYNAFARANALTAVSVPWVVLVVDLALPPVVFGIALLLARRRTLGALTLLLVAGLGLVEALTLSLTAIV